MITMDKLDFSAVYNKTKNNIWKLVSRYVFSREDREDLFQEIFLSVHKALPRFREESSVDTWVYRISVNTALNFLKKQKRYKVFKDLLSNFRTLPNEIAEADVLSFKPLQKLNPQQRMILVLSDVEDVKLEEIAEIMKIPVGTIKSNLHRAREIVKKELRKHEGL